MYIMVVSQQSLTEADNVPANPTRRGLHDLEQLHFFVFK
jgi:hypothetical protein